MLSNDDLDRLEKLCEAATPGEWTYRDQFLLTTKGEKQLACIFLGAEEDYENWCKPGTKTQVNNGEFIAASRTAMPELIAEVRALRAHAYPDIPLHTPYGVSSLKDIIDQNIKLRAVAEAAEAYEFACDKRLFLTIDRYERLKVAIKAWRSGGRE